MEIEINGEKYESIEQPKRKAMSKMMLASLALAGMSGYSMGTGVKKLYPLSQELVYEFKLIQEKKSKLSRSERDRVEQSFYKYFKKL